jgi:hypothetical protein
LVEVPVGDRRLRIGVEVKDHTAPLDVEDVEQLGSKLDKLDLDKGCIVAAAFTAEARLEAERCGLELRQFQEVGAPEWWLAPAMETVHDEIETLSIELVYSTEQFYPALQGLAPEQAIVVVPGQPTISIDELATQQGIAGSCRPELNSLEDGDTFCLNIEMSLPVGSLIQTPSGEAPIPGWIRASYKLHQRTEAANFRSYRMRPEVTAVSCVSELTGQQITFVGQDQPDGSRLVSLSLADASPKRTRIGESRIADPTTPQAGQR